ncbi:Nif3-like dinuclear metal center hexameric protein [Clostridium sp. UBA6640]|uniref:Nif3-like dinuclear metal center hexameric protein n=1 Tax=Clostridium sp. UBA6640 TaxID=1946370 RepID=UPI0025BE992A|nr:Nif3-like dinuclear metal center hexameric protein [Clostridium sp. UBA6640]
MLIKDFEKFIIDVFTKEKLNLVEGKGEYGFTNIGGNSIRKIGYCTNLTPDSAREAAINKVDLLITHHDAWEWIDGMKKQALSILKENNISHFYIHAPLDDAEFGTNVSLLEKLGFKVIEKFAHEEGFYSGRVGEIDEPISLQILTDNIENLLEESVRIWKNNDKKIKKVGVVTGAGFSAIDMKEAVDLGCDAYFTGEKILYTIQYAKQANINLIVGSHTFTEIFGVESLCSLLKGTYPEIEIIKIKEEHIE